MVRKGVVVRNGGPDSATLCRRETTHCASSPLAGLLTTTIPTTGGESRENWHLCVDFWEKMTSFLSYVCELLGGIWFCILSRARMLHIEHRAFGQKRILPEGWLYNSQKFILIEFFALDGTGTACECVGSCD